MVCSPSVLVGRTRTRIPARERGVGRGLVTAVIKTNRNSTTHRFSTAESTAPGPEERLSDRLNLDILAKVGRQTLFDDHLIIIFDKFHQLKTTENN